MPRWGKRGKQFIVSVGMRLKLKYLLEYGPMSAEELARRCYPDTPMMKRMNKSVSGLVPREQIVESELDRLCSHGMVEKDGRLFVVTPKGAARSEPQRRGRKKVLKRCPACDEPIAFEDFVCSETCKEEMQWREETDRDW